jgi:hypothetical protein
MSQPLSSSPTGGAGGLGPSQSTHEPSGTAGTGIPSAFARDAAPRRAGARTTQAADHPDRQLDFPADRQLCRGVAGKGGIRAQDQGPAAAAGRGGGAAEAGEGRVGHPGPDPLPGRPVSDLCRTDARRPGEHGFRSPPEPSPNPGQEGGNRSRKHPHCSAGELQAPSAGRSLGLFVPLSGARAPNPGTWTINPVPPAGTGRMGRKVQTPSRPWRESGTRTPPQTGDRGDIEV